MGTQRRSHRYRTFSKLYFGAATFLPDYLKGSFVFGQIERIVFNEVLVFKNDSIQSNYIFRFPCAKFCKRPAIEEGPD